MEHVLEQDRLNVANKSRANIFNWRGQFTPQFIEYLLEKLATGANSVLDPFCGSGTVLQECTVKGLKVSGFEINPAAYAMSKFFTFSAIPMEDRVVLMKSLRNKIEALSGRYNHLPLFRSSDIYRERYKNLLDFARELFSRVRNKREMLLSLLVMFKTQDSGKDGLISTVWNAYNIVETTLFALPFTKSSISVYLEDARNCHKHFDSNIEAIITSPPYINVFNYHQNYRAILELLDFDMLKVAQSEIGSNRKNRSNRFRTVIEYCLDMELALYSFAKTLSSQGLLTLILGRESHIRGVPFENSEIAKDIISCLGCFDKISSYERTFVNRYGQLIKEDIIVTNLSKVKPFIESGREIGVSHLERAFVSCERKLRNEISEAISLASQINPSKLFSFKEVI